MAVLGIHLGGYVHVAAASVGLSFALHGAPELFLVLMLFGAAFLAWLGVALFRNRAPEGAVVELSNAGAKRRALTQSVAVEALNPATAMFFIASLPLFVDPSVGVPHWLQFVLLGALTNLILLAAEVIVVVMAGSLMLQLRQHHRARDIVQRAAGLILIALALHTGLEGSLA